MVGRPGDICYATLHSIVGRVNNGLFILDSSNNCYVVACLTCRSVHTSYKIVLQASLAVFSVRLAERRRQQQVVL